MDFDTIWRQDAWRRQVSENSARLAMVWGSSTTTGSGSILFEDAIEFGITFIEQPMVSYGTVLLNPDAVMDLANAVLPLATGMVVEWVRDANDFWVGAHVALSVQLPMPETPPDDTEMTFEAYADGISAAALSYATTANAIQMEHHFTFAGTAMKDVESDT